MHNKTISRIAVIGAGTMGHGIGQEMAHAGYEVILYRRTEEKLEHARQMILRNLRQMAEWGLCPVADIELTMGRIEFTTSMERAARDADLAIEAVVEDLELKKRVFADLDRLCPEHTILASNTSSLMPSLLAEATRRPDRVLVAHFSFPPHLIPLVEIVRGRDTSDEAVQAVYEAVKVAGKSPVLVQREAMGFIINRMQAALQREALYIVEQGIASAQDVDTAVKESFGRRLGVVGPLEMVEVQDGWDITWQIHSYILPHISASKEPSPLIKQKVERGELGPKAGQGFYSWTDEAVEVWRTKLESALAGFLKSK